MYPFITFQYRTVTDEGNMRISEESGYVVRVEGLSFYTAQRDKGNHYHSVAKYARCAVVGQLVMPYA